MKTEEKTSDIWTDLIDKLDDKEFYYSLKAELDYYNKEHQSHHKIYHNGLELAIWLDPEPETDDELNAIKDELTKKCGFSNSHLYGYFNGCIAIGESDFSKDIHDMLVNPMNPMFGK